MKSFDENSSQAERLDAYRGEIASLREANKALTADAVRWNMQEWRSRAEAAEAKLAEARRIVGAANDAIAEYIRYLDGGEMRGSYDGKPERDGLRRAHYAARGFLARKDVAP